MVLNSGAIIWIIDGVGKRLRCNDLSVFDCYEVPAFVLEPEPVGLFLRQPISQQRLTDLRIDWQCGSRTNADHLLAASQSIGEQEYGIVETVFIQRAHHAVFEAVIELFHHTAPCCSCIAHREGHLITI